MSDNLIGLMFEIAANPAKAEAALAHLKASAVAESGEISSIWSTAMNAITGPTAIAFGGMTALGGSMLEAANKAAEMGNRIYEASEKTAMSAEALSGLMALSKETGKSFESLSTSFARATVNIAKAADSGKGALADLFTAAQLQSLKLKPVDEQMHTVLQRIFALTNAGERNQALQALMGRGWQENVGILKMLANEGYGPAIEQAKKLHVYYDDKAAQDAHTFGIEMRQIQGEVSGLGLIIGRELLPHFTEWLAELHTVNYEAQLLQIGLEAQGISIINFSRKVEAARMLLQLNLVGAYQQFRQTGGIFDDQLAALAKRATEVFTAEHAAMVKFKQDLDALTAGAEGAGQGAPGGPGGGPAAALANDFRKYGPTIQQLTKQVSVAIDGITKSENDSITSLTLWEIQQQKETYQALPLWQHALEGLPGVFSKNDFEVNVLTKDVSTQAKAVNLAKRAMDGLAASMDNAGGKSSETSQKFMQAAQAMAQMAEKAQEAADKGEDAKPGQQIEGMMQIAATALLTYKQRAVVEAIYYAAKSAAAFATGDYWAGAEFALASGLFAEAAGTASKSSSNGGGGSQSSDSRGGGSGSRAGSDSGSGGGAGMPGSGTTIHMHIQGMVSADTMQQFFAQANSMVKGGQLVLTASNALYNGPKMG